MIFIVDGEWSLFGLLLLGCIITAVCLEIAFRFHHRKDR